MRPLTPAEWEKPNSQTGEARLDILKKLIQQKADIVTVDGDTVKLATDERNYGSIKDFEANPGNKAFTLYKANGDTISSSKIAKSPVFGGGKGAGGGTENTAYAESQQCFYLAAMLKHKNKPIEFFTPEVLESIEGKVDTGKTTLQDTLDKLDPAWGVSAYLSAQALIKQGYVTSKMKFHRDSPEMRYIYLAKKTAFKNSGLSPLSDDKWNPGDIWAIDPSVNLKRDLDVTSIAALNNSIFTLFEKRLLIPISLKIVKKKAKIVVQTPKRSDTPTYKFNKAMLQSAQRGNFWSNKSGQIIYSDGRMDIKANAAMASSKVEILGKTARAGGAGWGVLVQMAKRYMREAIPLHPFIKSQAIKMEKGDKAAIANFKMMAAKVDRKNAVNFEAELAKKDKIWIASKYAATMLCFYIVSNRGRKADEFINAVVNYAASTSEDACIHIVVKE